MTTRDLPSSDFYGLERTLEPSELAIVHAVRAFMRDEVEPIINDYWTRAKIPFQILDGFRQLGIAGLPLTGVRLPRPQPHTGGHGEPPPSNEQRGL